MRGKRKRAGDDGKGKRGSVFLWSLARLMLFSPGNLAGASAEERRATAISRKTNRKDNDRRISSSDR